MRIKLTENFYLDEFECRCGCGFGARIEDVDLEMVRGAQMVRSLLGTPLYCVRRTKGGNFYPAGSGCRCVAHNRRVGGAPGSMHLLGRACDLWGQPVRMIAEAARLVPVFRHGGVITYLNRGFVHLDSRGTLGRPPYHARVK